MFVVVVVGVVVGGLGCGGLIRTGGAGEGRPPPTRGVHDGSDESEVRGDEAKVWVVLGGLPTHPSLFYCEVNIHLFHQDSLELQGRME